MLSNKSFPGMQLRKHSIQRISEDSLFWEYIRQYHSVITDYLTYGGGLRGSLFHFLLKNNYMMLIGVKTKHKTITQKIKNRLEKQKILQKFFNSQPKTNGTIYDDFQAALLVGYPKNRNKLKTNEIYYLQEVAQYMNMLMQNYTTLINEIEKRQRIRELQSAAQVQRRLPQNLFQEINGVEFAFSSEPAVNVSGDYLEVLPLDDNRLACFLGDVSGHGLGSGYLASSLQAIIHSHLQNNASLSDTIQVLNHFLLKRYRGDEFVTLVAFILDSRKRELEYLNAAHPSPYLYQKNPKPQLIYIKNSQPVIGVLSNQYHTTKLKLESGSRLFLYSDGVPETFNKDGEVFSEERLEKFVEKNIHLPPKEMIQKLRKALANFRAGEPIADDTSIAILDFRKEYTLLENILSILRLDRS